MSLGSVVARNLTLNRTSILTSTLTRTLMLILSSAEQPVDGSEEPGGEDEHDGRRGCAGAARRAHAQGEHIRRVRAHDANAVCHGTRSRGVRYGVCFPRICTGTWMVSQLVVSVAEHGGPMPTQPIRVLARCRHLLLCISAHFRKWACFQAALTR